MGAVGSRGLDAVAVESGGARSGGVVELDGEDLARGRDGPARLEIAPDGLVLSWRGVEFTLSAALEAPLRRLLAGEAVACAEIQPQRSAYRSSKLKLGRQFRKFFAAVRNHISLFLTLSR